MRASTPGGRRGCYDCVRFVDEELCYAIIEASDDNQLGELIGSGRVLIPTRLAASPVHALQAYRLAARAVEGGYSRARKLPVEVLLYLVAARGGDATRLSLSEVASEGPRPREPLLVPCSRGDCERLIEEYGCAEPEWSGLDERLALARTALAALEVERKRGGHEGTA